MFGKRFLNAAAVVSLCAVAAGSIAACKKSPPPEASAADAGSLTMAVAAPSGSALFGRGSASLGERFDVEAHSRPAGTPKAEDVFAAFEKAGFPVTDRKQTLASTVSARYCVQGTTKNNVTVSVCEYEGEAAAAAGRDASVKAFAAVQNRDVFVRKATMLTLLQAPKTPASEAEAKREAEIFSAM